jgi:hypothetical protein
MGQNVRIRNKKLFLDLPIEYEFLENEYSYFLVLAIRRSLYNIFLSIFGINGDGSHNENYFIEIIRQTPAWIKKTFDFEAEMGYSILGRRSYEPVIEKKIQKPPLEFKNIPQNCFFLNQNVRGLPIEIIKIPELLIASKIINTIWAGKADDSPTNKSYANFIVKSFEEKLSEIHNGIFPVSCQAIRDMFLHAAFAFPELKVRGVSAYNVTLQFRDLIGYTHAAAEVFIVSLNQWVLIDPWFGFVLRDECGLYLSAEDIACYSGSLCAVPLIEKINLYHLVDGSLVMQTSRKPIDSKINEYSFSTSGHVPSYSIYFKQLEYFSLEKNDSKPSI